MTELLKRRNKLRLRWHETPESLDRMVIGEGATTILYGDMILLAGFYYNGPGEPNWFAAVYETLADEYQGPETDLGLANISPDFFEDEGHAIEWAIKAARGEA